MNGGATNHTNIDQWLSEYPRLRKVILDPLRQWVFLLHPPPREDNDEWTRLIQQIDPGPELERLIGEKSSDFWTNPPQEPPS